MQRLGKTPFLDSLLVVLLGLIFIFPQSFAIFKLPILFTCFGFILINAARGTYGNVDRSVPVYYLGFSTLAILWAVIGALRGNPDQAVIEATTMYCLYMWIYAVLVLHMSWARYIDRLQGFMALVSVGISCFVFYVLLNYLFDLNWLSQRVREEMYLGIGVHDGYIQMNNINVGMFCFLIPFLLSSTIVRGRNAGRGTVFALVVSVLAVLLASRRIVFVLILVTPLVTYVVCRLSQTQQSLVFRRCVRAYGVTAVFVGGAMIWLGISHPLIFEGLTERVLEIFVLDSNSVRQLQHQSLVDGFMRNPYLGSGFGGLTDFVRPPFERPWTFELTYSKLLFNGGLLGVVSLLLFFGAYVVKVLERLRRGGDRAEKAIPLFVGFVCVMIASASNPYLSSFDFLVVMSVIPLIINSIQPEERVVLRSEGETQLATVSNA